MRVANALLLGALVLTATPAAAQNEDSRVNFNVGGGYTFATGEVRNHIGDGYNVNVGLIVNATKTFGIQFEYNFNGLGEKEVTKAIAGTPGGSTADGQFFAKTSIHAFNFNAVIKPGTESAVKPYVIAGGGVYYRPVEVTTPSVGYIPGYCDPWWYVCYPGGWVPVDKIVGSRSETSFGVDFGGGVNFKLSDSVAAYFEVRYHYILGKDYAGTDATGMSVTKHSGSSYIPITFGIRF